MIIDSYNLAAIDVGSNAARLLIKHVDIDDEGKRNIAKRLFLRVPLRLGMDVFADNKISKERGRMFVSTMKAYHNLMKAYRVKRYRACATSAMRDAENGKKLMKMIKHKAGVKLETISGDEESRIIYDYHLSMLPTEGTFLYVDVGGGSTEISLINNGQRIYGNSFNVGTIRLLKGKVKKDDILNMKAAIARETEDYENIKIIGSGGNINKLYRLASKREKLDNLPVDMLKQLYDELSKLSVEERMEKYNLKPDRADVIVPAAEIFLHVAACSKSSVVLVPNLGLADGIINDMLS